MTAMACTTRFLMLDPDCDITAIMGGLGGLSALLGGNMTGYEIDDGLCFAYSTSPSALRHATPNLYLSRLARMICQVGEPFYGTVAIFGGLKMDSPTEYDIAPLRAWHEMAVLRTVNCTRGFLAAHPAETADAIRRANRIRSLRLDGRRPLF